MLGAEPAVQHHQFSWSRGTIAVVAGVLGAIVLRRSHPVLGFLNFSALASNTHAVVKKERRWQDAGRRMGRHFIATAGSLALPKYPIIGYVAGAVGADMLIDGEGSGVIEEWSRYTGIGNKDVIDVDYVEEPQTALAVRDFTRCLECGKRFVGVFRGLFRCADHEAWMNAQHPRPHSSTWTVDGGGPPGNFSGGR